ncbi:MAG: hypothetical protein ACRD0C_08770 [Acidimicrobiia bacterium]
MIPHPPAPSDAAPAVLVVGTDDWAVEQVASSLSGSGYRALTCHPPGQPAFPCNALVAGRTCPLDVGFDVVVTVRARPVEQPTVGEMGVTCGLRAGAGLVVAGMGGRNPFLDRMSRKVSPGDSLAEVVADVAAEVAAEAAERLATRLAGTAAPS